MNEKKIISMLLDYEDRLIRIEENMFTKTEGQLLYDAIDKVLKIVTRMNQEHTFLGERVSRNENRIKRLETV